MGAGASADTLAAEDWQAKLDAASAGDAAKFMGELSEEQKATVTEDQKASFDKKIAGSKNRAFVFLKPAAVTDAMKKINIVKEAQIDAKVIDEKKLIDNHYYAIASKAVLLTPDKLTVPADKFKAKFEVEWADVLKEGKALNALAACEALGVTQEELGELWKGAQKSDDLVKLGGGFYCAKMQKKDSEEGPLYVFNGFYMTMRSGFVKEGACIHYYSVEWDSADLSWADFRGAVLGPTDPAKAPEDSVRGRAYKDWEKLGLAAEPNTGENCAHASASPFEGLCERMNWLEVEAAADPWGAALLAAGITADTLNEWKLDPQVKGKSIWDQLEDMDCQACIDKCVELSS